LPKAFISMKRKLPSLSWTTSGQRAVAWEIDFGSFLAKDIKAFLVAAIVDYYGEPAPPAAADFIA
jgi:hypothetical protein